MNNMKAIISIDENQSVEVTPETDISSLLRNFKNINKDFPYPTEHADDSIVSRKIYKKIFSFYNEITCRGDTLNTYNSTFKNRNRLTRFLEKEKNSQKKVLLEKIDNFSQLYLAIGNFTVFERGGKFGINMKRGSITGKLKDSWPLTLLCIQDFLSKYKLLDNNYLKPSFEENAATITFFNRYKNHTDGFKLFCDEHYFSPKFYGNNPKFSYIVEKENGDYEILLDLFDGLSFKKPLPENLLEMEQYIDNTSLKIIERGKILIAEYNKTLKI